MTTDSQKTGVLFICMGNICRSPLAEGAFLHLATERGVASRFRIDSCGMGGWHVGERPDKRAEVVAKKNGVLLPSKARRFESPQDWEQFHWLIPMDLSNRRDLLAEGAPAERIRLLRSFDPALTGKHENDLQVPDPYYGGDNGFDVVFEMVRAACAGLLEELIR